MGVRTWFVTLLSLLCSLLLRSNDGVAVVADQELPADPSAGKRGNVWVRATHVTEYFVVRTRVTWFLGHWSSKHRRSIRCGGDICALCAAGGDPRPFLYVGVFSASKNRLVLELNRRQRPLAESLNSEPSGGVGCQLAIRKDGRSSNSPIVMVHTGYEDVEEESIGAFVATLGAPAALVPADVADDQLLSPLKSPEEPFSRTGAM